MNSTIYIHNYLTTCSRRCIGKIKLLFSLNHQLQIKLNGKNIAFNQTLVIINHNDLYEIIHAEHLVEVNIPLQLFNVIDDTFFNYYFNFKLLKSENYIKHYIFCIIEKLNKNEHVTSNSLLEVIKILIEETRVKLHQHYLPSVITENSLLNKIIDFIHNHAVKSVSSKEISDRFFVTAPYISILFKQHLGLTFKAYVTSLKIALSFNPLLQSDNPIQIIAEALGFKHYSSYTQQFKSLLNETPNVFRKKFLSTSQTSINLLSPDNMNISTYIDSFSSQSLDDYPLHNIDLNHLNYNNTTKSPVIFIHTDDLIEIMQSNLISKLAFNDIADVYLLINNIGCFNLEKLNLLAIIDFIDGLFSQNVRLGLRIKSKDEYRTIENMIIQLLNTKPKYYLQKYMHYFLLLFDTDFLYLKDINDIYLKSQNLNIKVKLAISIEGTVKQIKSVNKAFEYLSKYHFDYYFIDIESSQTRACLNKYSSYFDRSMSYLDYFNKIISLTNISKTKFVYAHVSKHCFKLYDEQQPLSLSDLMCHMLIIIQQGAGVGYKLIKTNISDLSIMNSHYMYEPLMYLYQFLKPFINRPLAMDENLFIAKDKYYIHILLFNCTEHTISPQSSKKFNFLCSDLTTSNVLFIQTLNRHHGYIDYALPPSCNSIGLDKKLLYYIGQSSYPKSEIRQLETKNQQIIFELHNNEVKYIRLSII
ncbi:AraC family transcriptional regulator Rsp [Staphylococcus sp. ACRSN]|uniref:AraC family transcriptional regulator Rsp n=1 Tax=Staphylococcus sp. ACRSN TaxID=2918214 RepID=UPI001EF2DF97|nr:AraC family transcriptional regulator Rsp [Staphylococcus sp. ACRSN]MCG7338147.1 AraC family transcriptional regulator Rsp [Staphylococcus sp. ACRSN]